MAPTHWLMSCASELERLYMIGPRCGEDNGPADGWGVVTASDLAANPRYQHLDPVEAAQLFWRANE